MNNNEVTLRGLDGATPLGFLSAVGLLNVLHAPGEVSSPRLAWRYHGTWVPVLTTRLNQEEVTKKVVSDADCRVIQTLLALNYPKVEKNGVKSFSGLRPPVGVLRAWLQRSIDQSDLNSLRVLAGLMSETATEIIREDRQPSVQALSDQIDLNRSDALTRSATQTAFDFTSKNQQFIDQLRIIAKAVSREETHSELFGAAGGILFDRTMGWDVSEDRPGALFTSSNQKRNPVREWLAFRALPLFQVFGHGELAATTGCRGRRKQALFHWGVWSAPTSLRSVGSLIQMLGSVIGDAEAYRALSIEAVFASEMGKGADGYSGIFLPTTPV